MASVTPGEFVRTDAAPVALSLCLLEQKGLAGRLGEELRRASSEIASDPRAFLRDLVTNDSKDAKRRRRIYLGLAVAVAAHCALLAAIITLGWRAAFVASNKPELEVRIIDLSPRPHSDLPESAKAERPRGSNGSGGGGGGETASAATRGVTPQMLPVPQVVKPLAPSKPLPSLPVAPTIVGPESAPPPPGATLGIQTGVVSDVPSPGTGTGGGLGDSNGSGAGKGNGPGSGPGGGGGKGNGREAGSPDGTGAALKEIAFNMPNKPQGFAPFVWTYRARPMVTPEAQANKTVGTVLFRATFHANGTITDIEIVNPVDFMTESAKEALMRSKFRPATVNGVPVTLTRVPVRVDVHY